MDTPNIKWNVVANYLGQFYIIILGLVVLPFYLKQLGAESYGLVGFFTMMQLWLTMLEFGLSASLSREASVLNTKPNGLAEVNEVLRSIELLFFIITLVIFAAIFFASGWIATSWLSAQELEPSTIASCIKVMGAIIVFRWFIGLYRGGLIGLERQVWFNIFNSFINTIRFIGALLFIMFYSKNILHFFLYQLCVTSLEFFILRKKLTKLLPPRKFSFPSFSPLKRIGKFSISIAYTSIAWILVTQTDKLMLSKFLSLKHYGYFAIVASVAGAISLMINPIGQAIMPRMAALLANKKQPEMILLYHRATQISCVVVFSIIGVIAAFTDQLLFAWTGDLEASLWAGSVLNWYLLGNGIIAILAFQYYLQYAYGELKYHVRINTVIPIMIVPAVVYAASNYGAIGTGITWFTAQAILFLVWPPFIHSKFLPNEHKRWMLNDIAPAFLFTLFACLMLRSMNIDFSTFGRIYTFALMMCIGGVMLVINALLYVDIRRYVIAKIILVYSSIGNNRHKDKSV